MEDLFPQVEKSQSKRTNRLSVGFLVAFVFLVVLIGLQLARQNATQPTSGPAPDFELMTYSNDSIRLSDLHGKVVVLNFWASWCIPCRDEAPILQSLWEKYREQDVVLVGVAYLDFEHASLDFIEEFGITYPNGLDLETRISELYNITGVPETFVIDKTGNIVFFLPAPIQPGQLEKIILPLLS